MDQPYQPPVVDPYMMQNTYYQPSISTSSTSAPYTSFFNSQPVMGQPAMGQVGMGQSAMSQPAMSQPSMGQPAMGQNTGYMSQQQQLQYGSRNNGYELLQNNNGVTQLNPTTANLSQEYIVDFLGNEIKTAISSSLPAPYTMDSPEVQQYYQQLISVLGIAFQNQVIE